MAKKKSEFQHYLDSQQEGSLKDNKFFRLIPDAYQVSNYLKGRAKRKADETGKAKKVKAGASNPPTQSGTPKYQPHAGGSRRISQQHSKTFHMVNGKPRLFTSGNGENK